LVSYFFVPVTVFLLLDVNVLIDVGLEPDVAIVTFLALLLSISGDFNKASLPMPILFFSITVFDILYNYLNAYLSLSFLIFCLLISSVFF